MTRCEIGECRAITLTTGIDTIPGLKGSAGTTSTDGNDTIVALVDNVTTTNTTLNALDSINGGLGTNSMTLNAVGAITAADLNGKTITNVQTINARGTADVTLDLTSNAGITGVTALNTTQSAKATLTAAKTTDISVSGATDAITVDGGKNVTVTDATADANITVGSTTVNAGTITVTDTKLGTGVITIDGGTNVSVTASGVTGTGTIDIGQGGAATDLASGAVVVSSTGAAYDPAANNTMSAIKVTGGKTISVTQVATSDASKAASDTSAQTLTQGAVTIVAAATTTNVTVKQDAANAGKNAANSTGGVTDTASVKFVALAATKTVIINGLTLTATVDMNAAQVAAAFANLAAGAATPTELTPTTASGDTQSAAAVTKATYSGAINGWTSGAASGDTVVFTYATANAAPGGSALAVTGTGTAITPIVLSTGKANDATPVGGVAVIAAGVVDITGDVALKTVSVDGYAAAANKVQGAGNTALDTITLANGGAMAISSAATTLALSATNVNGTVDVAAGTTTLNATINGSDTTALKSASIKTVNVIAGSGKVSGVNTDLTAATAINTTGFAGTASFTIDGTATTYTGGAGQDSVTLAAAAALSKAIDLGDGNDTLVLAANTASTTATLAGGNGVDTVSMDTARAAALDDAPVTAFYTGFERLLINDAAASTAINLENLGFTNYVTTSGSSGTLTLDNLATNGTVVITAAPTTGYTINVKDATAGLTDVANVLITSAGAVDAKVVTIAKVETINITANDTNTTAHTDSLTLTADKATTLNVDGNAGLTLSALTGSDVLATINATNLTGALTVSATGKVAMTITGGSGADALTASQGATAKADVLNGGAGNDTLIAGDNGAKLTGGAGNDIFLLSSNGTSGGNNEANTYSIVEDFQAGDLLQLQYYDTAATAVKTVSSFSKLAAVLDPGTAVYTDYVSAALSQAALGEAVWFSFGGSAYVVVDSASDTTAPGTFVNTEDLAIKLTGIDLTNASWNGTFGTVSL